MRIARINVHCMYHCALQVAEKLRQQRLIEESDFEAAMDLFGGSGERKRRSLRQASAGAGD